MIANKLKFNKAEEAYECSFIVPIPELDTFTSEEKVLMSYFENSDLNQVVMTVLYANTVEASRPDCAMDMVMEGLIEEIVDNPKALPNPNSMTSQHVKEEILQVGETVYCICNKVKDFLRGTIDTINQLGTAVNIDEPIEFDNDGYFIKVQYGFINDSLGAR